MYCWWSRCRLMMLLWQCDGGRAERCWTRSERCCRQSTHKRSHQSWTFWHIWLRFLSVTSTLYFDWLSAGYCLSHFPCDFQANVTMLCLSHGMGRLSVRLSVCLLHMLRGLNIPLMSMHHLITQRLQQFLLVFWKNSKWSYMTMQVVSFDECPAYFPKWYKIRP